MSVNIFGKTNVGSSQRVISGGVTLSQAINTFLRRDGKNAADANINMDSHNIINVLDPMNAQDAATKNYVDTRAVSKTGDTMTGTLDMNGRAITNLLDPSAAQGAATKSYVDKQDSAQIITLNSYVDTHAVSKSGDTMTGDLNMGGRMVKGLPVHYPPTTYLGSEASSWSQVTQLVNAEVQNAIKITKELITKELITNTPKKSYSGYVPILEENISRTGFVATANAVTTDKYQAYGAFNNLNPDGSNGSWATPAKKGWLQIKCPEPVTIWKVALKARAIDGKNITEWTISGSHDGKTFDPLLTSTTKLFGSANAPLFFDISTTTAYLYYRLAIQASTGAGDLGVQVMQLYVLST
ncbi:hypothetical protein DPMN_148224 [Dreissena polymorpha]|uniref:F5/8 type C domain-containing protein n=1 Tax=Dreissena polymorpha TaxID=45954 RepID=A0A9D4FBB8_DREPO|nr:hypothetical protein DPMN_148224 [Dreissena polymorpha]